MIQSIATKRLPRYNVGVGCLVESVGIRTHALRIPSPESDLRQTPKVRSTVGDSLSGQSRPFFYCSLHWLHSPRKKNARTNCNACPGSILDA